MEIIENIGEIEILDKLQKLIDKIQDFKNRKLNEAQTINSLIRPFFEILGWDFTEPDEIVAQPKSKVGGSTPEYHFKINNDIIFIVEAKNISNNLNNENEVLEKFKYFNSDNCPLLIITNGNIYKLFYNDIYGPNKLLFEFTLLNNDYFDYYQLFKKDRYTLLEYAQKEKYRKYVKMSLEHLLNEPTDDFIKAINNNIKVKNIGLDRLYNEDIESVLSTLKICDVKAKINHNDKVNQNIEIKQTIKDQTKQKNVNDTTRGTKVMKFFDGYYPSYLKLYNEFLEYLRQHSIEFDEEKRNDYIKLENLNRSFLHIYPQNDGLKIYFPFNVDKAISLGLDKLVEGKDSSTGKYKSYFKLKKTTNFELMLNYIGRVLKNRK